MPSTFTVAAARVNALNPAFVIDVVRKRLQSGQGAAIATLNLDHVVKLRRDPAFREAYRSHDVVTADGFPIVLAGRLRGFDVVRTPGSDLVFSLAALAEEVGCALALIGSSEDSLCKAAIRLEAAHPGLNITLKLSPPFDFDPKSSEGDRIAAILRDSGAKLCFLALGAPKQEIFAARIRAFAPDVCIASIGAGLDFLSGHQVRAPRGFQRLNLEWAWRLFRDPRRLAGRYALSAITFPRVILAALLDRSRA